MDSSDVDQAVTEMARVLTPHESADWRRPAGALTWSCWETAAHVAHDLLAYAGQLAALPDSAYLPFDLVVRADASPRDLLRIATGAGRLLSSVLATAPAAARAWHWGPTDPSGFAAMGVNETLIHTHDIAEGLGIDWRPPEALCRAVLARLFPHAPAGDPVQVLLWSTGRADLPGRPRPTSWLVKAAVGYEAT
ncbi:maleylpyruvate isomerase N-terminal domain-containing protein [Plantactinospora siamensis]|uniref:Maleylpyruvate isomerase N-terminal domain-containing protein n=1 Tax=Plantactinospora siamensis TaxID=555372 RepID=A0ABV6NUE3_9ACTN